MVAFSRRKMRTTSCPLIFFGWRGGGVSVAGSQRGGEGFSRCSCAKGKWGGVLVVRASSELRLVFLSVVCCDETSVHVVLLLRNTARARE